MISRIYNFFLFVVALAIFTAFINPVLAAPKITIATGDPKFTYSKTFNQLNAVCKSVANVVETTTTGSAKNIELALDNNTNLFYAQLDSLFWRKRFDDMSNLKVFLPMYPEQVHVYGLVDTGIKVGGNFFGYGKTKVVFNTVEDLQGVPVGVVGGSKISADIINEILKLNMAVIEFNSNDDLKAALEAGKIKAGISVAAAPIDFVKELSTAFRLIPFKDDQVKALAVAYRPATLSYPNLGAEGVQTVTTQSAIMVQNYTEGELVAALTAYRSCAYSNLNTIRQTTGNHRAWRFVNFQEDIRWPVWNSSTPAGVPAAPTKKAK